MWLLSTDRAELHYFANNFDATGGYAILSHTWNQSGEQTLQEVRAIGERCKARGTNPRDDSELSLKIRNCCIVAEKHGYRWVWIDSCCIDKTSSSELSEAINSMFRWYKEAEVCFAYLADVPADCDLDADGYVFRNSRWHTRGWTLQELIAPDFLIFLSTDWYELGNRAGLSRSLEKITRVPSKVLNGEAQPAQYSISIRMSWASERKTTRVEDEAYCLMGLFGVSLPTNYGEGKKAFIRLQYEIMQHNPDLSLFAFGLCFERHNQFFFHPKEEFTSTWQYLMADSPQSFFSGFEYIPDLGTNTKQQYPPLLGSKITGPFDGGVELPRVAVTSYGVDLRVPIYEADGFTIAVILCTRSHDGRHFGLFLTRDSRGKDPKRPRYFTGCAFSDADLETGFGSARVVARLADLGDDLSKLTFKGKPVKASWRTVYVVPTPSHLDSGSSTTPNLIINCNPACGFRVPRWLVARFIALRFDVKQLRNTEVLQVLQFLHRGGSCFYVSFGSCTAHRDHNPEGHPRLWANVDIVYPGDSILITTFTHDCRQDHLDSESWATCSRDFGGHSMGVRLSLTPSTRMSDKVFVVHLELVGSRFYWIMMHTVGVVSLFPSLADLEKGTLHIAPNDLAPAPSRPHSPLQIVEPTSSSHAPSPPSSHTHTHPSTSTVLLHTPPSRIPRPVPRSPPNALARDRQEDSESPDHRPKPEQGRGSRRECQDARRFQTFSPTPPTSSHSPSGTPGERGGTNNGGRTDSRGVGGAVKGSDPREKRVEGENAS